MPARSLSPSGQVSPKSLFCGHSSTPQDIRTLITPICRCPMSTICKCPRYPRFAQITPIGRYPRYPRFAPITAIGRCPRYSRFVQITSITTTEYRIQLTCKKSACSHYTRPRLMSFKTPKTKRPSANTVITKSDRVRFYSDRGSGWWKSKASIEQHISRI